MKYIKNAVWTRTGKSRSPVVGMGDFFFFFRVSYFKSNHHCH